MVVTGSTGGINGTFGTKRTTSRFSGPGVRTGSEAPWVAALARVLAKNYTELHGTMRHQQLEICVFWASL